MSPAKRGFIWDYNTYIYRLMWSCDNVITWLMLSLSEIPGLFVKTSFKKLCFLWSDWLKSWSLSSVLLLKHPVFIRNSENKNKNGKNGKRVWQRSKKVTDINKYLFTIQLVKKAWSCFLLIKLIIIYKYCHRLLLSFG